MLFDERATYDTMLSESWQDTFKARDAAKRLVELLRDAEQAHIPWVRAELEALLVDGAKARCKTWWDARNRVRTSDGKDMRMVGGTRRKNAAGDIDFEQLAFSDMERPEMSAYMRMLSKQIEGSQATVDRLERLLVAFDLVPEADTAREACEALGTTVRDVMEGVVDLTLPPTDNQESLPIH